MSGAWVRWGAAIGALGASVACAPQSAPDMPPLAPPALAEVSAAPEGTSEGVPEPIARMLARLVEARGLAAKHAVEARHVSREEAIAHIMAKTEKEMPRDVLEGQGELLRGLGLVPPSYDFVAGIYGLIRNNIAGFYDQHDKRMFLLDDLSRAGDEETLAHELAHALQDQHYDLVRMLRYRAGAADVIASAHSLCEGDATAAMVATLYGDRVRIDPDELRLAMMTGVAFAEGGATPRVLQLALVTPYVDGFEFVEALRAEGGWEAVDAAFARLPISTEQLLHPEKYAANEPPLDVRPPLLPPTDASPAASGGFEVLVDDVLGEQGLRLVLESWTNRERAREGATGWGGDRFVVGRRRAGDAIEHAAAWTVVFDREADAVEAEAIIAAKIGGACRERAEVGPLAFRRRGAMIVLVAGPYAKRGDNLVSTGSCQGALRWVDTIFASR